MDFLLRFDSEFAPRLGARAPTFRAAFERQDRLDFPNIVETGCARINDNWAGDGQSTLMFDAFVDAREGRSAWSVDISADAVEFARDMTEHVQVMHSDSVPFLAQFHHPISLLYLDSYDFDANEPMKSATHHVFELTAAMKNLAPGSIVMVDDTSRRFGRLFGKGMLIAQYMEKIGAPIVIEGECQVAWML